MKIIIACQICGTILTIVHKSQVCQDDINEYEQNTFCNNITNGVVDGQQNIQAISTCD